MKKTWGFIYKYFITNKNYVGQTALTKRASLKMRHMWHMKENKSNPYFHNSLRKYFGPKCLTILEVFYDYPENLGKILNESEQYWIKYFDCFDEKQIKGWNLTKGGNGTVGRKHTEETKQKQSEKMKGEKHYFFGKKRPEHAEKMKGENHPFFGKHRTEETKQKLSIINKGEKHPQARKVILFSPEGQEYSLLCYSPFCKTHSLDSSSMSKVLQGKLKHHHGWTGKYLKE